MDIGLYSKAIFGTLTAGAAAAIPALSDGVITPYEWTVIVGAVIVSSLAIWLVPNAKHPSIAQYAKAVTGALAAAVAALGAGLVDGSGLSAAELLGAFIALGVGFGVTAIVPNAAKSDILVPTVEPVPVAVVSNETPDPVDLTTTDQQEDGFVDEDELDPPANFDDGSNPEEVK